jgi:hypothetical protein
MRSRRGLCAFIALLFESFVLAGSALAQVNTVYISQNGGPFSGGSACNGQTTQTPAWFNTSSNWTSGTPSGRQIGPGTVVYLCGTLTSGLTFQGSGNSSNPIEILFDSGANMTNRVWSSPAIALNSKSYIIVDGGTPCGKDHGDDNLTACASNQSGTGLIENTANGTLLANKVTSQFIVGGSGTGVNSCGSNIEIRNLLLLNAYVKSGADSSTAADAAQGTWLVSCGSNIYIHDNTSTWGHATLEIDASSNVSNWEVAYNVTAHATWGIKVAMGTDGVVLSNVRIHDNEINNGTDWSDSSGQYHLDGIFDYGHSTSGYMNGVYVYNNYLHGTWGQGTQCPTGYIYLSGWMTNTYAFNNVINVTGQYACNGDIAVAEEKSVHLYNNTIVSVQVGEALGSAGTAASGGFVVGENNVVYGTVYPVNFSSGAQSDFGTWDYNDYYNYTSDWRVGRSWYTWRQWQAQACGSGPCDAHGSIGNPKLASSYPFTLGSGSAAIGLGANLYSVCNGQPNPGLGALCYDRLGNARPSTGKWDAGAYNGVVSAPLPPTGVTAVLH